MTSLLAIMAKNAHDVAVLCNLTKLSQQEVLDQLGQSSMTMEQLTEYATEHGAFPVTGEEA